jgi:7-cyano-7-deazaguanine synthase
MPNVITTLKAGPIPKRVLLFSGGLDSLCFAHLLNPDLLLYIPSHSPYTACERYAIHALAARGAIDDTRIVSLHSHTLDLSRFERDDMIVPNRNAHLVMLASHFGDSIILSSVSGDRSTDKDEKFYDLMTALLNHMWSEQHWTSERKFTVGSPYKNSTKTQLVGYYLSNGGNSDSLLISYSCYVGDQRHCGICKACARKRVALDNNNIGTPLGYFKGDFMKEPWFREVWPLMLQGKYRGREDQDFVDFMGRYGHV